MRAAGWGGGCSFLTFLVVRRCIGDGRGDVDLNGLVHELFVVFAGAAQQERVGECGFSLLDAGDDVRAAEPVGFGEVGLGPLRGMVGVRVVKADDVQAEATRLALNFDQLLRGDVVAVVRGVGAGVASADDLLDVIRGRGAIALAGDVLAEQHAAALVRVGLFAVSAQCFVIGILDAKHSYSSVQKRSPMYLSAPSHRMVTITASRPCAASSSASCTAAAVAAAAETPTSTP